MKIISYNINKSTQAKIDHVLSMGADLYILPECARQEYVNLPEGYSMMWTGDDDVPQKGLGIIWKKHLNVEVVSTYRKIKHILPITVCGDGDPKLIIASWPTIWNEKKTYPQLLMEALNAYGILFNMHPTLVIGDFNCYIGQSGVSKKTGTFEDCIKKMTDLNLISLYHHKTGEEFGKETESTFFWRFKEDSPFHIDYAFCNKEPKSFSIGEWEREISDHRPLFVEL